MPNTPRAASITAILPTASLREQRQTERMFALPSRWAYRSNATPTFAARAKAPTMPIVTGCGPEPRKTRHAASAITAAPYTDIDNPFTNAARDCQRSPRASAPSDRP